MRCVIALCALLGWAAPGTADVEVDEDYRYYLVGGETPAAIWRDMRAKGPTGRDGRKYNATTEWRVRWRYPYARSTQGCSTGPVTVTVMVIYRLPEWDPPRGASGAVASQWNRYVAALEEHEQGHGEFGIQAARRIQQALEALPPESDCGALARVANETGQAILAETRPLERDYDRVTNHGATQGTAFFRDLAEGRTTSR